MFETALQAPWTRLINHILRATPRAMTRLQRFTGKTMAFKSGPFHLRLAVLASGEVDAASQESIPDVTVTAPPILLPRLAVREEAAFKQAVFEGDAEFAAEIAFLARNLEWDVEEDLSKVVGDIAAHRIVSTAKSLRAWRKDATVRLGENVREYLTEERPALVPRRDLREFLHDVDAVRDDVARLEKRLARLVSR
jgi:ubiquinone biosynthesis protein UbiJ